MPYSRSIKKTIFDRFFLGLVYRNQRILQRLSTIPARLAGKQEGPGNHPHLVGITTSLQIVIAAALSIGISLQVCSLPQESEK